MSFGDSFGKPDCNAGTLSVKRLKNPPAALRKHNGRNKDLRRHIIEHAGVAVEEIVAAACGSLEIFLREQDLALLATAMALRQTKLGDSPEVTRYIVDLVLFEPVVLGIGCVKGQHRSVAVVEHCVREDLIQVESMVPYKVVSYHRELENPRKEKHHHRDESRRRR